MCVRVERVAFSIGWVCPGECEVCRSNSTGQNMRRVRLKFTSAGSFPTRLKLRNLANLLIVAIYYISVPRDTQKERIDIL